jgi:FAD/FMN-containing dehydrogenase/Fe-S oxidoreductase
MTSLPQLSPSTDLEHLANQLRGILRGEVRFGLHDRMLYATDASVYQVTPLGVVTPVDADDVTALMRFADQEKVPVLPRGGGTSLAGQCTNRAVVADLSPHFRKVLTVDIEKGECLVEPGIGVDELNRALAAKNVPLFFAPDPATSAHCAIGGCIGNNAAGARSIQYGRTSENLLGVEVVLPGGDKLWLEPGAGARDHRALTLAHRVADLCREYADLIRSRFPKTIRRNAGYGLDLVLKQLDAGITERDLDLSGLICGSEGTLALITQAKLKLHPIPKVRGLAILAFATLEDAMDAVVPIVGTNPSAVELLDDVVLDAARLNNECRKYLSLVPRILPSPGTPGEGQGEGLEPKAILYVEYQSTQDAKAIEVKFEELKATLGALVSTPLPSREGLGEGAGDKRIAERLDASRDPHPNPLPQAGEGTGIAYALATYLDPASMGKLWALRKAGEPLLHGIPGNRKPQTFVEDNAVPVENLARFVAEFKKIVARHGTHAAYYAHASVGVLHVRPLIDLHDEKDRDVMRKIAVDVADLARDCGGVMSGEHGDGRVRGPLLERFYGPELMTAFRKLKAIFDPNGILNPGMIVDVGPIESITDNLRTDEVTHGAPVDQIETYYDYEDQHGFRGAAEMCNGAGVCRKTSGGTMCPSYRGTLDERHATRGRGNALRMAISGQFKKHVGWASAHDTDAKLWAKAHPTPDWNDNGTLQTLDLCLSCKACKSECPSNVDIARLKAEYLAQSYKVAGTPLKALVFGHVRKLNKLGSIWPAMANRVNRIGVVRAIMNRVLHLAPQRSMPPFGKSLYGWFRKHKRQTPLPLCEAARDLRSASPDPLTLTLSPGYGGEGTRKSSRPKVVFYADCFATYNEPHVGKAAIKVLEACGYDVLMPEVGCCGRAMMSTGLLKDAIWEADQVLLKLRPLIEDENVVAIVACEPSCVASFKDDWLQLKLETPMGTRKRLAQKAMLVEEFVEAFWEKHPTKPTIRHEKLDVILHGHCHQKALWGDVTSSALLKRLVGDHVTTLPSGCCGMAGSFGYDEKKYDLSMKIGELSVFPPIRAANPDAVICAPGTSCRHQIHDGTGRHALHPIELAAKLMAD